jgi:lipopolysaccharide export LptBFGC system permease protein LptF
LLLVADTAARQTQLPIAASVWLPNLVFAVASTALMVAAERPSASAARFATRY